jgi:glutamate-5-semialdehyde dehydrogenase
MEQTFKNAVIASRQLNQVDISTINQVLQYLAALIEEHQAEILAANAKDLALMDKANPKYDRLLLNAARLESIAADLQNAWQSACC